MNSMNVRLVLPPDFDWPETIRLLQAAAAEEVPGSDRDRWRRLVEGVGEDRQP